MEKIPEIDEIANIFWDKTEKLILEDGEINPLIFGVQMEEDEVSAPIDLFSELTEYNWSDPEDRYNLYYHAFRRKIEWELDGLVSIFESWTTTLDVNGMLEKGLKPDEIKSQDEFYRLSKEYPDLFDRSESLSLYIEWKGSTRLLWGRIFRENNDPDGRVVHISEYVEHNDDALDGIIRDARKQAIRES